MPGSNLAVVVGAEVVKTLLMMAFQNARMAGLTPEEIDKLYVVQKQKFSSKNPATLRATLKDLGRE